MQRVVRELAEQHHRMQPYGPVFALFMEGNFAASVLLLDTLWDVSFAKHVREEFVVALPARTFLLLGTHRPRRRWRSSTPSLAGCTPAAGAGNQLSPRTLPPQRGNVG